ncbi:MAG: IS200/IS605 family transposase [Candidatus Pacearchaeota archaeon]
MYKNYETSVGNNLKHIQLPKKYRYKVMNKENIKVLCKVLIEEACKGYKIEIVIPKVKEEYIHLTADLPMIMSDAKAMQLIKGFSSYLLFRLYSALREVYHKGHFWNAGYFCCPVGVDFDNVFFIYRKSMDLSKGRCGL